MEWRKRGHIYAPDGSRPWAVRYAAPPTPHRLDDERLRVYVAFGDTDSVGRVGYVDVRLDDPAHVVGVSERPVLDAGARGAFDEHGVVPTCVLAVGGELRLYYAGYRRGSDVEPYTLFLGLAVSTDGGESFERYDDAPVLAPSDAERTTRGAAHVVRDGDGFVMYYSGGSGFVQGADRLLPVYNVRRLRSDDGLQWGPVGEVCVDLAAPGEHAIARPWLLRPTGGVQRMLYCYRSVHHDYRIGLATSADGTHWERSDTEAGIAPSGHGWDATAVAYPAVVEHERATYLLHSGDGRGATGFGYAELVSDDAAAA